MMFRKEDVPAEELLELLCSHEKGVGDDRELDLMIAAFLGTYDDYALREGANPEFVVLADRWRVDQPDDRRMDVHVRNGRGGGTVHAEILPSYTDDLSLLWEHMARRLAGHDGNGLKTTVGFDTSDGATTCWVEIQGQERMHAPTVALALCASLVRRADLDRMADLVHPPHIRNF